MKEDRIFSPLMAGYVAKEYVVSTGDMVPDFLFEELEKAILNWTHQVEVYHATRD